MESANWTLLVLERKSAQEDHLKDQQNCDDDDVGSHVDEGKV